MKNHLKKIEEWKYVNSGNLARDHSRYGKFNAGSASGGDVKVPLLPSGWGFH